jgi:NitT/TauT family transport system ATP-binding protein
MLDEPFGVLAPGIRGYMHELLLKLWRDTGLTVFMVTHDLKERFTPGSRMFVFDKVKIGPHAPGACKIPLARNQQPDTQPRAAIDQPLAVPA